MERLLVFGLLSVFALSSMAGAYTVKKGDTLYSIATNAGVTVDELRRLNNLDSNTIHIGQVLRLSGLPDVTQSAPKSVVPPAARSGTLQEVGELEGVSVSAPAKVNMGGAFILRLSGTEAGNVKVSFPSELGEDVRSPAEVLAPVGAAEEYRVLGRVVLGKTSPVLYEVSNGREVVRGKIPVVPLGYPVQHLSLGKASNRLKDKNRPAEEAAVERVYALRTPQAWNKPFVPALQSTAVSSQFGQPRTYVRGGKVSYHYGVDYPARLGTPVAAMNSGRVVMAGNYPVRGGLVVLDHGNGVVTLYFHLSKIKVRVGEKVERGQTVGAVGSTGLSGGPHLHLEMRVRGEAVDPRAWMGRLWP